MSRFVSEIVTAIPPSGIRRFFEIVAETEGVISLGVGEPDFHTPWHIREAAIYAIEKGFTHYTANAGLPQLLQGIAQREEKVSGLHYNPKGQIVVTVGVSEGLDLALRAVLSPGDEVIMPEPCYVSYQPCTLLAGGRPVPVLTTAQDGFRLTPESVEAAVTEKTKIILLCYPNNPTGAVLGRKELEGIARIARERDLLVISDEIYADLSYDQPAISIASLPGMIERTIVLNGFSKNYAMTGWRIGYACGPREIIAAMVKIHQYTMLCAPIVAQLAAVEALAHGDEEKDKMRVEYDRRRKFVVKSLNEMGLVCAEPQGAFYAFPDITCTGLTSEEFATALLNQQKVAVVPGTAFGPGGEGYIRISYASSIRHLQQALEAIGRFLESRK